VNFEGCFLKKRDRLSRFRSPDRSFAFRAAFLSPWVMPGIPFIYSLKIYSLEWEVTSRDRMTGNARKLSGYLGIYVYIYIYIYIYISLFFAY